MKRSTANLFCLALVFGTFQSARLMTAQTASSLLQPRHVEVPFEIYQGYLIVFPGRIGPLDGLKFALDTGATHSVISREVAKKLQLATRPGKVLNIDETVPVEWAVAPSLKVGATTASDAAVMVADLGYFRSFSTRVDAVIGLDMLRRTSFSVDFLRKVVTFGSVESRPPVPEVPMKSDPACLRVEAEIDEHPIAVVVDTGMQGVLLYEDGLLKNRVPVRYGREITGVSIRRVVRSKLATVPHLRLGSTDMDGRVLLAARPGKKTLVGIDGFMGIAALDARRVNFNFEKETLSWTK